MSLGGVGEFGFKLLQGEKCFEEVDEAVEECKEELLEVLECFVGERDEDIAEVVGNALKEVSVSCVVVDLGFKALHFLLEGIFECFK